MLHCNFTPIAKYHKIKECMVNSKSKYTKHFDRLCLNLRIVSVKICHHVKIIKHIYYFLVIMITMTFVNSVIAIAKGFF